ncbi:MAG: hypothetical protein ABSB80_00530 [Methanoregula sp.]|jgi:hypothetical protein|uniref:hypothetical protein n=1 Tax=Methanoregula sp. TaxID=2052170 RepID=UPI003D0C06C0
MMEKAGYLQQTRYRAQDSEGTAHEVVELHILGNRYAIRRADLIKAVSGRVFVQVEELSHNWNYYLGQTRGLAHVSASGKALNIELFENGNFTLSLTTLRAVVHGKERSVVIVKIPETPAIKIRRIVDGQQKISAVV